MIKILTFFSVLGSLLLITAAPYIAAAAYATVSLLQPQHVWFWAFDSISIFKITAGIAIVAWFIKMLRGGMNWQIYNNGIFYGIVILCGLYYLSESLSPFQNYSSSVGSTLVMDIYTTIVIMFFIVLGIIDHEKALKWIVYTVIGVTLYYTWWANIAYFESNWSQFTQNRLRGPNGSPYKDGNIFSILFVIGLPFVLFAIYNVDKKWQKLALILVIPLIWHAMVLCASRGALLSAGVSTLAAAWMIKSKSFNVVLLAGFIGFMITQGGEMVSRTLTTVERAETKEQTETINPRILSWQVGIELIKKYPLFGAGPQRFQEASRFHFPGKSPHVAHNTFLNFASNIGLIAGFIYLSFFWLSWRMYKWNKMHLSKSQDRFHTYVNNASFCSLLGFFTGALFLDLIIFEPFFFLLIIIIANNFILKKHSTATALDEKEKSNIKPSRISISARQQQT